LAILVSPYAPHIAEELWAQLGHTTSIATVDFPVFDAKHLVETSKEYPVSFNGKMRFTIELPLDLTAAQIEEIIMKDERTLKQLDGKNAKQSDYCSWEDHQPWLDNHTKFQIFKIPNSNFTIGVWDFLFSHTVCHPDGRRTTQVTPQSNS
jgi:leucyl-tRNA synthetase